MILATMRTLWLRSSVSWCFDATVFFVECGGYRRVLTVVMVSVAECRHEHDAADRDCDGET
jgi:hypothetical protein